MCSHVPHALEGHPRLHHTTSCFLVASFLIGSTLSAGPSMNIALTRRSISRKTRRSGARRRRDGTQEINPYPLFPNGPLCSSEAGIRTSLTNIQFAYTYMRSCLLKCVCVCMSKNATTRVPIQIKVGAAWCNTALPLIRNHCSDGAVATKVLCC